MLSETLQKKDGDGRPLPPLVVRLCNNAAVQVVHDRMRNIARSLAAYDDPELDIGAATGTLLATSMELLLRMGRLKDYPFALCRLSKTHFPVDKLRHLRVFLNIGVEQLDVGCGLEIHTRAWEEGTESGATVWLLSSTVQTMIDRLVDVVLRTSLEAERRHAQVKKWERF